MEYKDYIAPYVSISRPVEYKGLKLYPIKVKDYYEFLSSYDILDINKNKIPDVEVIQMTYLQYVVDKLFNDETIVNQNHSITFGNIWELKFANIMELCLGIKSKDVIIKHEDNKITLILDGIEISANDFDDLRKLILFQNLNTYDDTILSEDVENAIRERNEMSNKGLLVPQLEDMFDKVMLKTGLEEEKILNMTYRRFERIFKSLVEEVDYTIFKMAECQGAQFKNPIDHWIYKSSRDKYADIFGSINGLKEKLV